MPPRGFTNPAPKTESARSALSSFTCTLCNKSYSRHPEYEAHIGSYDHQHRKRLQDLKQLSRDPQAAEKARRAERKADAEAGLRVIDAPGSGAGAGAAGGGPVKGFKKGGFKSSFASVKGVVQPVKKNVLGDEEGDKQEEGQVQGQVQDQQEQKKKKSGGIEKGLVDVESEDEDYAEGDYYDPRKATGCFAGCGGAAVGVKA